MTTIMKPHNRFWFRSGKFRPEEAHRGNVNIWESILSFHLFVKGEKILFFREDLVFLFDLFFANVCFACHCVQSIVRFCENFPIPFTSNLESNLTLIFALTFVDFEIEKR
jgi:hypothetical protein